MLVGVVSDGVDTGLAVETRSWSSSAVPFPHEDLKHMVSDGGWPWGWVGGEKFTTDNIFKHHI